VRGPRNQIGLRAVRGKKKVAGDWPGWRGPHRNGRVAWLPDKLPAKPNIVWEHKLFARGVGGVAATADHVFVSDRELNDTVDCFKCLSARDGKERWAVRFPCAGELDFGASPRATPLIHDGLVFFFGALGHLHCVEIESGNVLWQMDIRDEFGADDARKWGMCSSPLIAGGKLVVNPGAKNAALVALEPRTGKPVWKTPGAPAGYGSMFAGVFGGREQIVGYDLTTLGGWDAATGRRLWTLTPPRANDFNVPTPMQFGEYLVVTTENNGTRLYRFGNDGVIHPTPVAHHGELAPDSHSPVIVGDRLFGIWNRIYCLDLKNGLKTIWTGDDDTFAPYAAIVASDDKLLVVTLEGELILVDAKADRYRPLSRMKVFADERGVYSHPAFVGTRMYLRGNSTIVCVELK
jgi:outer membrane protein assembly factor BamB